MNKRALKLKKQRRLERENEKQLKKEKVWNDMITSTNYSELHNLKKTQVELDRVYNAVKRIDKEVMVKAAVVSLVCSLKVLKDNFNYDKTALIRYGKHLRDFINQLTDLNRPILKIIYEIEHDYDIPLKNMCDSLHILTDVEADTLNRVDTIIKATHSHAYYFIGLNAYTFMNDYVYTHKTMWNKEQLTIFVNAIIKLFNSVLINTGNLKNYNIELLETSKIDVNLQTGTIREII